MILSAVPLSLLAGPVPPAVERCSGPEFEPSGPDAGRAAKRSEAAVSMGWSGRRVGRAAHDGGAGIHRPVRRRPIEGRGTWTYR
jgi:hypothetical protein